MKSVGLIGCGAMGSGIAYSLSSKGHDVRVYDYKNNKNVDPLIKNGVKFVPMQNLVENSRFIIMCLPNASVVENVCFSNNGLLDLLSAKNILIDTTTSHPDTTQKIQKYLIDKNIKFADAPLTRSPIEAMQGKLNSLVGSDDDTYGEIEPILLDFCENVLHIGEVGSGHTMKLLNNFICMSFTAIVEFGLFCGNNLNIDLDMLNKVMSLGSNYVSSIPLMLDFIKGNDQDVLKFSLKNATKDMKYFFQLVENSDSKKWFKSLYDIYYNASEDITYGKETLPLLYEFLTKNDKLNLKKEGDYND
jgi:3-hydroxyisobutyrate dehydrogenase-like beta-hydroxyacid dehydrogenase